MDGPRLVFLVFVIGALSLATACERTGTAPSGSDADYAGTWTGLTSQGEPIAFTVSSGQTVTSISISYRFNGCSGTNTFPDLSLPIGSPSFPPRQPGTPQTPLYIGFGFGSSSPEGANYIQVLGTFTSASAANGTVALLNFGSCGNAAVIWNATKR